MNAQVMALGVGNLRRQRGGEHPVAPQGEVESVKSSDFEGPSADEVTWVKNAGF